MQGFIEYYQKRTYDLCAECYSMFNKEHIGQKDLEEIRSKMKNALDELETLNYITGSQKVAESGKQYGITGNSATDDNPEMPDTSVFE